MALQTDRLLLRTPRPSDAPAVFAFLGDAEAMRFTHRLADLRACRRFLAAHERQRAKIGCAPWVILRKTDQSVIGFGGLYVDPFDPGWGVEVGYFFAPAAWGQGYASELTRFCLGMARHQLGLTAVSAFAHPENTASRRVLEKAGFVQERFVPAMNRHLYTCRLQARPRRKDVSLA
ncbi:GNAT family N-acetyltransferase [Limobrevibacterium gyesilva]|uniref:GNAT family N-acetyltransferase n=1 Tax=Limobrevibacterium gyesilva TaxID=2991712 RepID=A0AA41YRA6_9PROT|nr:GNAT family N-acetyltransferase [Limobrevibacterium gyesilva]MCW3474072.1 GNAT family N-acetyltransferase [Limobrevibacterium gyesilva]